LTGVFFIYAEGEKMFKTSTVLSAFGTPLAFLFSAYTPLIDNMSKHN